MKIKRRIIYTTDQQTLEEDFDIHFLEPGDSVRTGFEKGTLQKVSFELISGHVIEYERNLNAPDFECFTIPNGDCIIEGCKLHGPT